MYSSFFNQSYHLAHYIVGFIFLFIVVPRFIFSRYKTDSLELTIANYMKMVFLLIIMAYFLVLLKLFEVIAIVLVLFVIIFRKFLSKEKYNERQETATTSANLIFDYFENKFDLKLIIKNNVKKMYRLSIQFLLGKYSNYTILIETLLVVIIYSIAIYTRFADAIANPVPPMSDGYVGLAWMKYIDQRILFNDQIYPQGFYMYMDYLHKFSFIYSIYILKYTGPLTSILTMLGTQFVVHRFTKNRLAGIMAALVYGLMAPAFIGGDLVRQATALSQEFAFVFFWPTVYFWYLYIKDSKKENFWAASAGTAVMGLVHSLVYAFIGLAIAVMLLIYLFFPIHAKWKKNINIVLSSIVSIGVALFPVGIGYALGKRLHTSSNGFLLANRPNIAIHTLHWMDYLTLFAAFVVCVYAIYQLILNKKSKLNLALYLFLVLFSAVTFFLFYFGGHVTGSVMLMVRSPMLWGAIIPVIIGISISIIFEFLHRWKLLQKAPIIISIAALLAVLYYIPPKPLVPYKLQRGTMVEQVLNISHAYYRDSWMLVAPEVENYSLILGHAFHMYTSDFLSIYNPDSSRLNKQDGRSSIPKEIFVVYENNIYEVSKSVGVYSIKEPDYIDAKKQMVALKKWIIEYQKFHENITVFYKDKDFTIYHIRK